MEIKSEEESVGDEPDSTSNQSQSRSPQCLFRGDDFQSLVSESAHTFGAFDQSIHTVPIPLSISSVAQLLVLQYQQLLSRFHLSCRKMKLKHPYLSTIRLIRTRLVNSA